MGRGIGGPGRWKWIRVEREVDGRWVELETPLEIGKEASLEVVVGTPLELVGERMGGIGLGRVLPVLE